MLLPGWSCPVNHIVLPGVHRTLRLAERSGHIHLGQVFQSPQEAGGGDFFVQGHLAVSAQAEYWEGAD